MYSIIDIETTGGAGRSDKITEISVFVHDGTQVVDQFTSLVNPERMIPPNITAITGIDNAMVSEAPKFYEIAKRIVEMTEGTIFLAHNVNFDYSFVKEEFKRLGFNYNRKRMCTVRLARKFLPGHRSYSLGKVCEDLGIPINGRHRAEGDAAATVKLFEIILAKNGSNVLTDSKQWVSELPEHLDRKVVEKLPEETGVYYFYDKMQKLIYIGKSKNIYSRTLSHLGNVKSKKTMKMREEISDISYEITGSELIALLLESDEIKAYKPFYNVAQRKTSFLWGINAFYDMNGYLNLEIVKNKPGQQSNLAFASKVEATRYVETLISKHRLCQKLSGTYKSENHCFNYMIKKCDGACGGEVSAEDYNKIAEKALQEFRYKEDDFVIIESGRHDDESSFILIQDGKYQGYGYFDNQNTISSIDQVLEHLLHKNENRDIRNIINGYMNNQKGLKIISFSKSEL